MIPTLLPESEYFSKNDDDFETSFVSVHVFFMPSDYLTQQWIVEYILSTILD